MSRGPRTLGISAASEGSALASCTPQFFHTHVGQVASYGKDVSFTAFAWPDGEMRGTKQTATRQAALTAFTSMTMPRLMIAPGSDGDWSLTLFPKDAETGRTHPALRTLFHAFQRDLANLAEEIAHFNDLAPQRPFPYNFTTRSADPSIMDTSISV
jgi:hypothetical protein